MLHNLLNPLIIVLLFVFIRSADIAISASRVPQRDTVRMLCYGLVSILALIFLALTLF